MKLDHVGIAVANSDESEALIARLLGRPAYKTEEVTDQQVLTTFFEAGSKGAKLELVSPAGPDSVLHKYLAKRGPGIHHLAFEVSDILTEMKRLAADGFELLQTEPTAGADNKLVCFLHPKTTNGVLVEICQTSDNPGGGSASDEAYWSGRYDAGQTGWDAGQVTTPIKEFIDCLTDKSLRILIPGAGNGHEAQYAWEQGFRNTHVLDIAEAPLANLRERVPDFPADQAILGDFFTHRGAYDLILEQTFFCSLPPTPENRQAYGKQMHALLADGGRLAGLWFDIPLVAGSSKRPFGGSKEEYLTYLEPYFRVIEFSIATNSIAPRAGRELFGIFQKQV